MEKINLHSFTVLIDNEITDKADVKWNFEKFVIDKNGNVISRFPAALNLLLIN